jgi:hypothetical protein
MPTLLEVQKAMWRSVVLGNRNNVSAMLSPGISPGRLDIYRNTFLVTLTRALRLCFPAVAKLVGEEFFEGAAQIFVAELPPRAAWLDQYGEKFADFLGCFEPAQSAPYLADVARLEWAVNTALHAADAERLDPAQLTAVNVEDQGRICLIPEPSISLLQLVYPADLIWNAVLSGESTALGEIDLTSGPVDVRIERRTTSVAVDRLPRKTWRFLAMLCAGRPIEAAIRAEQDFDVSAALAEHLSVGRFVGFYLAPTVHEEPI